jgi:hypothetical protein
MLSAEVNQIINGNAEFKTVSWVGPGTFPQTSQVIIKEGTQLGEAAPQSQEKEGDFRDTIQSR